MEIIRVFSSRISDLQPRASKFILVTIKVGNGDNSGILLQDIRPTAKGK
jgi:hypothetical protein